MREKKKSSILAAVHETASGLSRAGVMDQVTKWEFDHGKDSRLTKRHDLLRNIHRKSSFSPNDSRYVCLSKNR
jgi:DNA-binding transcriptional regulator YiaG